MVTLQQLTKPKIYQFQFSFLVDKNVLKFQIPMDYEFLVQIPHCVHQFLEHRFRLALRQKHSLLNKHLQVVDPTMFHDDKLGFRRFVVLNISHYVLVGQQLHDQYLLVDVLFYPDVILRELLNGIPSLCMDIDALLHLSIGALPEDFANLIPADYFFWRFGNISNGGLGI